MKKKVILLIIILVFVLTVLGYIILEPSTSIKKLVDLKGELASINYGGYDYYGYNYGGYDYGCSLVNDYQEKVIAVKALLSYVNMNNSFVNLCSLSTSQKTALNNSLNSLSDKNFVVFNGKVGVLSSINDIKVYNESDKVYLQVKSDRILLADLTGYNAQRDCSGYYNKGTEKDSFMYVMCYADNYARANPAVLIGEQSKLVDYIENYFKAHINNFDNRFNFSAYQTTISVFSFNNSEPGIFIQKEPFEYSKEALISLMKQREDFIIEAVVIGSFYVVEKNIFKPLSRNSIIEISNLGSGNYITGRTITGYAASSLADDESCRLTGATESGLPCNDRIDAFLGLCTLNENMREACVSQEASLTELAQIGYELNLKKYETKEAAVYSKWIEAIIKSNASLLHIFFHGGAGNIGPIECTQDVVTLADRLQELDKAFPNTEISKCVKFVFAFTPFDESICPTGGYYELYLNIPCVMGKAKILGIKKKALLSAVVCCGVDFNSRATFVSDIPTNQRMGSYDFNLFKDYLIGWGPRKFYYLGTNIPPLSYTYPPHPRLIYPMNVHVHDYLEYGGPKYKSYGEIGLYRLISFSAWEACYNIDWKSEPFNIPCIAKTYDSGGDYLGGVHLFPFIDDTMRVKKLENTGRYSLDFSFSDFVTKPITTFTVNNRNALVEDVWGENFFSYKFISEVEPVLENDWNSYSAHEKLRVFKQDIVISGSTATVKENKQAIVGNFAAKFTRLNESHKQSYWFYDPHFWMYNARFMDDRVFRAKIPYKQHPWVTSEYSNGITFSHPVKNENVCEKVKIKIGTGCVVNLGSGDYITEGSNDYLTKPFNNAEGKPRFELSDNGKYRGIEWQLRDDIQFVDVYPDYVEEIIPGEDNNIRHDWTWVRANWGPEFSIENWSEKYTVKITVSGIKSDPNDFSLMGNTLSPKKWNFDSDGKCIEGSFGKICKDAWEKNSHKVPQREGSFEIWIPCKPQRVACGVPKRDADYYNNIIYGYGCEDLYKQECKNKENSVEIHEHNVCLNYGSAVSGTDYYGEPRKDGAISHFLRPVIPCAHESFKMNVTGCDSLHECASLILEGFFTVENSKSWYFAVSSTSGILRVFGLTDKPRENCDNSVPYFFGGNFINGCPYNNYKASVSAGCSGASYTGWVYNSEIKDYILAWGKAEILKCGGDTWYTGEFTDTCCKMNEKYEKGCVTLFPDKSYTSC